MGTDALILPLHKFTGSAQGLCVYSIDGGLCGNPLGSAVHAVVKTDPVRSYLEEKAGQAYLTYTGSLTVDEPPTTVQGLIVWFDKCVGLAMKKNEKYRDAWQKQGYMGNASRILSKVERLRAMVWGDGVVDDGKDTDESLEDTLMDMANLCAFMARNLREGNRWGN